MATIMCIYLDIGAYICGLGSVCDQQYALAATHTDNNNDDARFHRLCGSYYQPAQSNSNLFFKVIGLTFAILLFVHIFNVSHYFNGVNIFVKGMTVLVSVLNLCTETLYHIRYVTVPRCWVHLSATCPHLNPL